MDRLRTYVRDRWVEARIPKPTRGTLLVEVAAFGVNHLDVEQAKGTLQPPAGAPAGLGLELSGRVVALGPGVRGFRKGDRVMSLVSGGAYANLAVVPVETTLKVPRSVDLVEAAALPEALFTGWFNIFQLARLGPGEALLVHGGTGGMGSLAIQMAAALGHPVYGTAGSAEKCVALGTFGARGAYLYSDPRWVERLRADRAQGVDVIYDVIGASSLQPNLEALAPRGRLVLIDAVSGEVGPIDLGPIFAKQLTVTASLLRPQPLAVKARIAAELKKRVLPLIAKGAIRPVVGQAFSATDEIPAIHAALARRARPGKIVVRAAPST